MRTTDNVNALEAGLTGAAKTFIEMKYLVSKQSTLMFCYNNFILTVPNDG